MTRRIVVTGPESTGKSTLAVALGARLQAPVVPEAARLYAELRPERALTAHDVAPIARLAIAMDDASLALHPALEVLDTDLVSTVVYARHYYGEAPAWIEAEARKRRADLYLLCTTDLPWQSDGVRDRPDDRETLSRAFDDAMVEFACPTERVSGEGEARLACALRAIAQRLPGDGR